MRLLLVLAAVVVAAAAAAVFALSSRTDGAAEQSPQTPLVSASADIQEQADGPPVGAAALLEAYFDDVGEAVMLHREWVTWEWKGGGTHHGALFGPRVAVVSKSGGSRVWPDSPSYVERLATRFAKESRDLASIEVPRVLRSDHDDLARAVRIEARRWRRFDAVVRKSGRAEWAAFKKWERWSKHAFRIQRRDLNNWVSAVRVQSRKRGVALPATLAPFVVRVEKLVQ